MEGAVSARKRLLPLLGFIKIGHLSFCFSKMLGNVRRCSLFLDGLQARKACNKGDCSSGLAEFSQNTVSGIIAFQIAKAKGKFV